MNAVHFYFIEAFLRDLFEMDLTNIGMILRVFNKPPGHIRGLAAVILSRREMK